MNQNCIYVIAFRNSHELEQQAAVITCTEAEYMACTRAAQETIWLRQLLEQLGFKQTDATDILGDNQGAIALAKNPGDHPRTKHIELVLLNYLTNGWRWPDQGIDSGQVQVLPSHVRYEAAPEWEC